MFSRYEGFEQSTNYVVMRENAIYDDFYASIYNDLYTGKCQKKIIDDVCKNTQAGKSSKALVLGSSTGNSLNYLKENGLVYVKGIEQSQSMINACIDNCCGIQPMVEIKKEKMENTMACDKNEFSHAFCLGTTIYENQEKEKIIENCYLWLDYGGYFIISLVDLKKYSFIPDIVLDEMTNHGDNTKINHAHIDFNDFEYKCIVDYNVGQGCSCERKETFTDKKSGNVRENIQSLFLESREKMVAMIKKYGFDEKGYMDNGHGLYTYIFVKST